MKLSIVVSGLPSSLNEWTRRHWKVRNRERMAWSEKMALTLLAAGLRSGKPMFSGPVRVSLTYHVKGRKKDTDNLVPKHLIDGMIGYVYPDDGPDFIPELHQRMVLGAKRDETHILVEPLTEPVGDM